MRSNFWKNQIGQTLLLAMVVMGIVALGTLAVVGGSLSYFTNSKYSVESIQATNLAEAALDKAVASLNKSGGTFNGDLETALGPGTYTISITSKDASTNIVSATGYIPNKTNPKARKTIQIQVSKGLGIAFNYGVQVGEGGLDMSNNANINGSVYSLGNISMTNSSMINGDAYVAGGTQPVADQQNDCSGVNCNDFIFGKNVSGNNILDVAQSFKPSTSAVVNKVSLKLKKTGTPTNLTVRIMTDNNGKPSKTVLTSGPLAASQVTTSPGFVDVALSPNPTLNTGTTYWVMVDASSDSSKYWYWSLDTLQSYNNGTAKWSPDWNAGNPTWNNTTPVGDFAFKVYMGGVATYITGSNSATVVGDAHANTITGMRINKDAYYQYESGNTVSGQSCANNTHCHPGSLDPPPLNMPISQANIDDWKAQVDSVNLSAPDCNQSTVWGPGKYTGNISMNNCKETIKTPIYITGNLTMNNSSEMKLDSSVTGSSGTVIVGNFINLSNNNKLLGSGTSGSFLIAISEFNSRDDPTHRDAITLSNSGNQGIVYSNLGSVNITNSNTLTEINAWKLILGNGVTINYDQGLASSFFSSGPSGSFSAIKGTYQSK